MRGSRHAENEQNARTDRRPAAGDRGHPRSADQGQLERPRRTSPEVTSGREGNRSPVRPLSRLRRAVLAPSGRGVQPPSGGGMSGTGPANGPAPTRLRLLRRVRRRPGSRRGRRSPVGFGRPLLATIGVCRGSPPRPTHPPGRPDRIRPRRRAGPAVRYLQHLRDRCGWVGGTAGPRHGLTLLGPVSRRDKGPGPAGDRPGDIPTLLHPAAVPPPRWSDQPRAYLL